MFNFLVDFREENCKVVLRRFINLICRGFVVRKVICRVWLWLCNVVGVYLVFIDVGFIFGFVFYVGI